MVLLPMRLVARLLGFGLFSTGVDVQRPGTCLIGSELGTAQGRKGDRFLRCVFSWAEPRTTDDGDG